ncbi:hypothetical protein SC377_07245 [Actinotignum sp. SLA_B059]|uniref:hypothetical protein n=1 Tax=Actinotignum sp. SLA_B059 TaxID=3083287 RepID=UPI002A813074|nr:hypothetical protein [Actinotignum sp. SLA_B059]MDY5127934.1 hypothetical protein [Actinotignum sp. SLA_B059]
MKLVQRIIRFVISVGGAMGLSALVLYCRTGNMEWLSPVLLNAPLCGLSLWLGWEYALQKRQAPDAQP